MSGSVRCEWLPIETINYSMQQNYVPVVRRLSVANTSDEELRQVEVVIACEPDFAFTWSKTIDVLPPEQTVEIGTVPIQLSASLLAQMSERISGTIGLTVMHSGQVLFNERKPIAVLAFDEWSGTAVLPEMAAAFVTPNHPQVSQIVREAADILNKWAGSSAFTAYQTKDPNRVRMQAAAVYSAIRQRRIVYCVAPPSFEPIGQRVRLPETIFAHGMGNCLDLTLLYAACLEAIGLHPLIVFTEGHAFAGLWLTEETFAEIVQDDLSALTKRLSSGINEICVVESTAMCDGNAADFDEAVRLGTMNLNPPEKFESLIDIRRARASAVRPLPVRTATAAGWVVEDFESEKANAAIDAHAPEIIEVLEKPEEVDSLPALSKQKQWERRLLDLTLRNALLNFRLTKSSIPIMSVQLNDLEDALADREEFQLLARPDDWQDNVRDAALFQSTSSASPLAGLLQEEFIRKRLRSDLNGPELERRLVHLYRSSRSSLEENGANTLYLALGLLKWYETTASEVPRYAPLALIPVDLIRKSSRQGYVIRARDEEPQMNITLLEMLKQDFGIGISGLDPLPRDEKGIALKEVFHTLRHALIQVPRWDVLESAYLGLFSFGQFVMWNDLRNRAAELVQNRIVASLMEGKLQAIPISSDDAAPLDEVHPTEMVIPISADSSQLAAVQAAAAGHSFVLHGPPGTGKSQTITNMIANALAQGKKVLFVAEKMAALSVVQRRLEQIGLGPFCLELHSNKSTKRAVLDQLSAALESRRVQSPGAWKAQADRLQQLRGELNDYVAALHRRHSSGLSLFDAISAYENTGPGEDVVVRFPAETIKDMREEQLTLWRDLAGQLKAAGAKCGDVGNHPLSAIQSSDYSPQMKTEVADLLHQLIEELPIYEQELGRTADDLLPNRGSGGFRYRETEWMAELSELACKVPDVKPEFIRFDQADIVIANIREVVEQGRRRDAARDSALTEFTSDAISYDARQALAVWNRCELQWFLPKLFGQRRIVKSMQRFMPSGQALARERIPNALNRLIQWQEEEQKLLKLEEKNKPLCGNTLWNEQGNWDAIDAAANWLERLQASLVQLCGSAGAAAAARQAMAGRLAGPFVDSARAAVLESFLSRHTELSTRFKRLTELLRLEQDQLIASANESGWPGFLLELARVWQANLDELRDWCAWRRVRDQAIQAGLAPLIEPYEQGKLSNEQLMTAFEQGLYKAIANCIIAGDEVLSRFSGHLFEDAIKRFKEADRQFTELTRQEIAARLSARVPQMTHEASQSSEAGILQRAIRSGGRALSIRKLFEQVPNLLSRLTPCMLMSPISVAQYLDPGSAKFDLVIFDEASQVPTAEAVGALARGIQAIIVGDPKQLPPTSFFSKSSSEAEEDEAALQDMESILDDCLAVGMPERHLSWHYRSRHESLIAFSNAHYYENKLLTFPSPDEPVSSVVWHPVDGFYDRGKSKHNRAEGEAVVFEIMRRLKDVELRKLSIGVVTFSSIQQTLIEDLLDESCKRDPELELLLTELPEPLFIKNLENVQGDERDVILFSVGYGPDAAGKVTLNFGPLNRQGGWRRLNVAVSRARREMHVFATLRSSQLNAGRISAEGVLGLKEFLEYAEKGKQALPAGASAGLASRGSSLHTGIADALGEQGCKADIYVGASGYRIDLGIVHPEKPGQYILGIVLDGPMYRSALSARDRDLLREEVLTGLGWTLHRVWSPDWWDNRAAVVSGIMEAIRQVMSGEAKVDARTDAMKEKIEAPSVMEGNAGAAVEPDKSEKLSNSNERSDDLTTVKKDIENVGTSYESGTFQPTAEDSNRTSEILDPANGKRHYMVCTLDPVAMGADAFASYQSTKIVLSQIEKVIAEEGPISRNLLGKRILQAWGIARTGAKLDQRFDELLTMLRPKQTDSQDGNIFYWPDGTDPEQFAIYRVASDEAQRRSAEDLPPEEIAAAVKDVLASQISLPYDELVKQTAKQLGYARTGTILDKVVRLGIEKAVALQYAYVDEHQRVVAK